VRRPDHPLLYLNRESASAYFTPEVQQSLITGGGTNDFSQQCD
jgi:hypothetical protein